MCMAATPVAIRDCNKSHLHMVHAIFIVLDYCATDISKMNEICERCQNGSRHRPRLRNTG